MPTLFAKTKIIQDRKTGMRNESSPPQVYRCSLKPVYSLARLSTLYIYISMYTFVVRVKSISIEFIYLGFHDSFARKSKKKKKKRTRPVSIFHIRLAKKKKKTEKKVARTSEPKTLRALDPGRR